jgi:hypothetical protein
VVLPASGCEIIAKVRLFLASLVMIVSAVAVLDMEESFSILQEHAKYEDFWLFVNWELLLGSSCELLDDDNTLNKLPLSRVFYEVAYLVFHFYDMEINNLGGPNYWRRSAPDSSKSEAGKYPARGNCGFS